MPRLFKGMVIALLCVIGVSFANHDNANKKTSKKAWLVVERNGRKIEHRRGSFIVKYKPGWDKPAKSLAAHKWKSRRMLSGSIRAIDTESDSISVTQIDSMTKALSTSDQVEAVEPNIVVKSLGLADADNQIIMKGFKEKLKRHHKVIASKKKHRKIKIGLIDSGIDSLNADLSGMIAGGINLISQDSVLSDKQESADTTLNDYNGHGTAMAGIIAGKWDGKGVDGWNDDVELYVIKAFNRHGESTLDVILGAIEWAKEKHIDVLNLSFGSYEYSKFLEDALRDARSQGMLLVGAAGNDFAGEEMYPARYESVIGVGSYEVYSGEISSFSNFAKSIDIYAPGSMTRTLTSSKTKENGVSVSRGTSVSAAHVTGLLSLLRTSGLNNKKAIDVLQQSAIHASKEAHPLQLTVPLVNEDAILSATLGDTLSAVSITELSVENRWIGSDAKVVNLHYSAQNIGYQKISNDSLFAVVRWNTKEKKVYAGMLNAVAPGKMVRSESLLDQSILDSIRKDGGKDFEVFLTSNADNTMSSRPIRLVMDRDPGQPIISIKSIWLDNMKLDTNSGKTYMNLLLANSSASARARNIQVRVMKSDGTGDNVGQSTWDTLYHATETWSVGANDIQWVRIPLAKYLLDKHQASFIVEALENGRPVAYKAKAFHERPDGSYNVAYNDNSHIYHSTMVAHLLLNSGIQIRGLTDPADHRYLFTGHNDWSGGLVLWDSWATSGPAAAEGSLDRVLSVGSRIGATYNFVSGSQDIDEIDVTYWQEYKDMFDSHFWLVDKNDSRGLVGDFGAHVHPSAFQKAMELLKLAKEAKSQERDDVMWWLVGQAVHLMADMSVPEHVDDNNSHGAWGPAYEGWMENSEHFLSFDWRDAYSQGGIIKTPGRISGSSRDQYRYLYYTTAQVGNSFPWAAEWSTSGHSGNRNALGDVPHYDKYMGFIFDGLPAYPLSLMNIQQNEVWDAVWSECQWEYDIWAHESSSDCKDQNGHSDQDNTEDGGNDWDGDLSRIANSSYTYGLRAAAGMVYQFAWENGLITKDISSDGASNQTSLSTGGQSAHSELGDFSTYHSDVGFGCFTSGCTIYRSDWHLYPKSSVDEAANWRADYYAGVTFGQVDYVSPATHNEYVAMNYTPQYSSYSTTIMVTPQMANARYLEFKFLAASGSPKIWLNPYIRYGRASDQLVLSAGLNYCPENCDGAEHVIRLPISTAQRIVLMNSAWSPVEIIFGGVAADGNATAYIKDVKILTSEAELPPVAVVRKPSVPIYSILSNTDLLDAQDPLSFKKLDLAKGQNQTLLTINGVIKVRLTGFPTNWSPTALTVQATPTDGLGSMSGSFEIMGYKKELQGWNVQLTVPYVGESYIDVLVRVPGSRIVSFGWWMDNSLATSSSSSSVASSSSISSDSSSSVSSGCLCKTGCAEARTTWGVLNTENAVCFMVPKPNGWNASSTNGRAVEVNGFQISDGGFSQISNRTDDVTSADGYLYVWFGPGGYTWTSTSGW